MEKADNGRRKERLTKSKERVSKFGEVFTPEWLVKDMCDMLPPDAWNDVSTTFLEPSCGTGNFLVEILNRKLDRCKTTDDCFTALASIYAIDLLPDNVAESKKRMLDIFNAHCGLMFMEKAMRILEQRIICGNSLEIMEKLKTCQWEDLINERKEGY